MDGDEFIRQKKYHFLKLHTSPSFALKLFWPVLGAAIVASHFFFRARYLYDWDAAQFALALDHFDILNHQPHPPGYILLVGLGKLFNFFLHDANQSFLTINLFCHLLSTVLLFAIGRNLFDENVGRASAAIFAFSPIVLFSCNITCAYGAEGLAALAIAWSVERSVRRESLRDFFLATIIFGIAGGIRQNLIILLGPLWAWGLFSLWRRHKISFLSLVGIGGVLGIVVMSWMVPLIHASGDWDRYQKATSDLLVFLFHETSVFYGISLARFLEIMGRLFGWLFILGLSFATIPLFILMGRKRSHFTSKIFFQQRRSQFLLLWILPAFIFYGLFHLPKPGYLLTYLGAFAILSAYALNSFLPRFSLTTKTLVLCAGLLSHFAFSGPVTAWAMQGSPETLRLAVFGLGGKYSLEAIRSRDEYYDHIIQYVRKNFDPKNTVIVSESWPKKHPPIRRWLRQAMVYLPEYLFLEISSPPDQATQSVFQTFQKHAVGMPFFEHEYNGMLKIREEDPTELNVPLQHFKFHQNHFLLMNEDFRSSLPASGWTEYQTPEGHLLFDLTLKPGQTFTYGKVSLESEL